jgi:prepilin-type N-terminal cleavage/methylation domain-containing protein
MQPLTKRQPAKASRSAGLIASAPTRSGGFTLLEVILAVTIAGALLAAAATLMVAVTNAWLQRQDRHFFEDHVDGVTEFLQASLLEAGSEVALEADESSGDDGRDPAETGTDNNPGIPIGAPTAEDEDRTPDEPANRKNKAGPAGSALLRTVEEPIAWERPPGFADFEDPLLYFRLKERPSLLVQMDNAPVTGVEAYLHFAPDEGLSLLWFTPIQEESEDLNDLRRTPLSDLVTKVEYIYWDERFERWETEEEPLEGDGSDQFILPRFLKLTFEYEGVVKERTITLPVPSLNALIF